MSELVKGTKLKTLKDITVHDRNTGDKYVIPSQSLGEIKYISEKSIVMCFDGKSAVYREKDMTGFYDNIAVL